MAYHAGSVAGDSEIMVIIRSRGPQALGTMAYYCADERNRPTSESLAELANCRHLQRAQSPKLRSQAAGKVGPEITSHG